MQLAHEITEMIAGMKIPTVEEIARRRELWRRNSGPGPAAEYLPLAINATDPDRPGEGTALGMADVRFSKEEQFLDPRKMLFEQLYVMAPWWRVESDVVASVAPLFGNAFLLSALGIDVIVAEGGTWPADRLTREQADGLELPADITTAGYMADALRFIEYAREVLPEAIPVGAFYLMSPYELAYLIRGEEIMLDMIDHPESVDRLIDLCTDLYLAAVGAFNAATGDGQGVYHYWGADVYPGGQMLCEDCSVMLSPALHERFVMPRTRRALTEIGGGWVHFCGNGSHIVEAYLKEPLVYGIQYGQVELNGPIDETVRTLTGRGIGVNSVPVQEPGEEAKDYFGRIMSLLPQPRFLNWKRWTSITDPGAHDLYGLWREAQEEVFGGRAALSAGRSEEACPARV